MSNKEHLRILKSGVETWNEWRKANPAIKPNLRHMRLIVALVKGDDWEALIEWLETLEDIDTANEAMAELKAAGGDRQKAGWLEWDSVEADLK